MSWELRAENLHSIRHLTRHLSSVLIVTYRSGSQPAVILPEETLDKVVTVGVTTDFKGDIAKHPTAQWTEQRIIPPQMSAVLMLGDPALWYVSSIS